MTTFADVLPVKQLESHKYAVEFEDDWCIGTGKYRWRIQSEVTTNLSQCQMAVM